jgi:hypothetical protein
MASRIRKNEQYRGNNDSAIRKLDGVYRNLEHLEQAVKEAGAFQFSNLRDGTMLLYDKDVTEEKITADSTGQFAVAIVELVR